MAELTESDLISKIADIDSQLATIVATLGASGTGATQYIDYSIGNKSVSGNQRMEQLIKIREQYQALLEKIPKSGTDYGVYDVRPGTGDVESEEVGDEV